MMGQGRREQLGGVDGVACYEVECGVWGGENPNWLCPDDHATCGISMDDSSIGPGVRLPRCLERGPDGAAY